MCTIAVAKKGHNKSSFFVNRKLYSLLSLRNRGGGERLRGLGPIRGLGDRSDRGDLSVSVSAVPVSNRTLLIVVRFSGIEFLLVTRS